MSCRNCEGCSFEGKCAASVEVPELVTLEEVEVLTRVVERMANDQLAAAMLADLDGNLHGLTHADMELWGTMLEEFTDAVESLAFWGDLDPHEPDEPLADWELELLAMAATGDWCDGLGPIHVGPGE